MTKLEKIEQDVAGLSPDELARFRAWFEEFESQVWDEKIARDAASGKLGKMADRALADHKAGRSTEF